MPLAGMHLTGSKKESALVIRQLNTGDFPLARCELFSLAAFIRDRVQMSVAGSLGLKVDVLIVLHPSDRECAGAVYPCVVVFVHDNASLSGHGIERENPTVLVVSGSGHENSP